MRLFYADRTEKAMNILRSKTRFDFYLTDCEGLTRLYTTAETARKAALEMRTKPYRQQLTLLDISREEMCVVMIDVPEAADSEFKRFANADGSVVVIISNFRQALESSQLSLEIVEGTKNFLALYGNRVPECGAGYGPIPKDPPVIGQLCTDCPRTCLCSVRLLNPPPCVGPELAQYAGVAKICQRCHRHCPCPPLRY